MAGRMGAGVSAATTLLCGKLWLACSLAQKVKMTSKIMRRNISVVTLAGDDREGINGAGGGGRIKAHSTGASLSEEYLAKWRKPSV